MKFDFKPGESIKTENLYRHQVESFFDEADAEIDMDDYGMADQFDLTVYRDNGSASYELEHGEQLVSEGEVPEEMIDSPNPGVLGDRIYSLARRVGGFL